MTSHQYDAKLPSKENTIFRRIMKCYEQKQYKYGLKLVKQILSNPSLAEHGETLAMKALLLMNTQNKRDVGRECAKKGLKNDVKSFICWHVYGMYQIYDKKYEEAIKCYRNALKLDESQVQILKDLSKIQIHIRDIDGFEESKYKLLKLRPTQQTSWIQLALAENFSKNYEMCLKILSEFLNTQNLTTPSIQYENSELLKYQNFVMVQAEKYQEALDQLLQRENLILDKLYTEETKAKLYCELNKTEEAIKIYWSLIGRNQENVSYYLGLEKALLKQMNKDELTMQERLHIYEKALEINPKALLPQKIPLQFTTGTKFRELADRFLKNHLKKGTPSLFKLIKNLYVSPEKVQIIDELIDGYVKDLESSNKIDPSKVETEWPTTLLWAYLLKARHCDKLGLFVEALRCVDKAIDHTPTFIDAYTVKAKIYKNCGNILEAYRIMNECQSMDTADRYLNCLCAKYCLKANLQEKADEHLSKFTKAIPSEDLNEMQCMWYLIQVAKSNHRIGDYESALVKCNQIYKHFQDMIEDEYDFHTYCPRKCTLVSYVQTLITSSYELKPGLHKCTDTTRDSTNKPHDFKILPYSSSYIQKRKYFSNCASIAIEIYLKLFDVPALKTTYDSITFNCSRKKKHMESFILKLVIEESETNSNEPLKIDADQTLLNDDFNESPPSKLKSDENVEEEPTSTNQTVVNLGLENSQHYLSQSELKKFKNKQKKAQLKKNILYNTNYDNLPKADHSKESSASNALFKGEFNEEASADSTKLIKTDTPLDEATKFLMPLLIHHWDEFETHYYSFEIYFRKGKNVLVLRSLLNMKRILEDDLNVLCFKRSLPIRFTNLTRHLQFLLCWLRGLPSLNTLIAAVPGADQLDTMNSLEPDLKKLNQYVCEWFLRRPEFAYNLEIERRFNDFVEKGDFTNNQLLVKCLIDGITSNVNAAVILPGMENLSLNETATNAKSHDNFYYFECFAYVVSIYQLIVEYLNPKFEGQENYDESCNPQVNGTVENCGESSNKPSEWVDKNDLNDLIMLCLSKLKNIKYETVIFTANSVHKPFFKLCIKALNLFLDLPKSSKTTSSIENGSKKTINPKNILPRDKDGLLREYVNYLKLSVLPLMDSDLMIPYIHDTVLLFQNVIT